MEWNNDRPKVTTDRSILFTNGHSDRLINFAEHIPLATFAAPLWDAHILDKISF